MLEEKEEQLIKAAEFGKMLLEENDELRNKMDEIRKECDKKLEVCQPVCNCVTIMNLVCLY